MIQRNRAKGVFVLVARALQCMRRTAQEGTLQIPTLFLCFLGLAACTSAGQVPPASTTVMVKPKVGTGTILSMRTVSVRYGQAPWRAALLTDGAAGESQGREPLVEFIVRVDDGETLSIVQDNEPGFHAGDRVVILRDDHTHLTRPG